MKVYSDIISEIIKNKNIESSKDFVKSKNYKLEYGFSRERYDIETEEQVRYYNKPKGRYELISITDALYFNDLEKKYCVEILSKVLKSVLGKITSKDKILVVGLGNRHISSDSLGAKVVGRIQISFGSKNLPKVMAIAPSVLGLTGIETYNIVSGVVNIERPTHLILIDSLCASNISRLGKSLQITNTGICPGSGIGNNRKCIDKNMADTVVSIGVPLLIYASTFVCNAFNENDIDLNKINGIMQKVKKISDKNIFSFLDNVKKVYNSKLENIIVSIKDIEETVDILSEIIAKAINNAIGICLN